MRCVQERRVEERRVQDRIGGTMRTEMRGRSLQEWRRHKGMQGEGRGM